MDRVVEWCVAQLKSILPLGLPGVKTTFHYYSTTRGTDIAMINLARKCDLPEFLPMAFYHITVSDSTDKSLDAEDLRRILLAKSRIEEYWWKFAGTVFNLACDDEGCKKVRAGREDYATPSMIQMLQKGARDPLMYMLNAETAFRSCLSCERQHREQCVSSAKAMFDHLATIFDM